MAPISISPVSTPNGSVMSTNSPLSPNFDLDSLRVPKLSVLRQDVTGNSARRPRFGRSTSVAFDGHGSVHDFLKMLKNERFRYMPHDGSNWDRILKMADNIGGVVLLSHDVLNDFMLNSEDATRLICDGCISLVQLGTSQTKALLKVFSVFHKMVFALNVLLRQNHLIKSTPDVRRSIAHAYQEFAHLTRDLYQYVAIRSRGAESIDFTDFDAYVALRSASFYGHLEAVSISMWTSSRHCAQFNIQEIRDFLSPQDTVVKTIMSNHLYSEFKRAEFTCEWFAPYLRNFITRNGTNAKRVFLLTGEACTGKTVLARWIYEKLQEPVDNEPYDVITYSVDTNVKYTTSPLALIKSLLLQLLDRKIGSERLIAQIHKAFGLSQTGASSKEVESTLWGALEACLDDRKLLILIDGLDQLSGVRIGNPPALETLDRITKTRRNVKAIVLSRPVSDAALKHCQEYLVLEDLKESNNDIRYYIQDFLQHGSELKKLNQDEKHEIIQQHIDAANGSFLWSELQIQTVKDEESASAILKVLQKAPKSVDEALDRFITGLDAKRPETKYILSWILAAERPLTLKELKALLEVDLDGCAYRPFSADVENTVRQLCGSLVVVRDGLVYLRHPSIRERLLATTSAGNKTTKLVLDLKEAHRDLATRSMAYVKIHLQQTTGDVEPQDSLYNTKEMEISFSTYHLFEYAARYWALHFQSSSLYDKTTGKLNISAQFKISFSNAVRLALFEGSCLARQYVASEAERLQNLVLNIRKTLFGEYSAAVLQSLVLELRLGRKFKDAHILTEYSYEAWKISRHICSTTVVHALAEGFVEYSLSLRITDHTEFYSKKEEILQYLVEASQHSQKSETKEGRWLGMLAELHVSMGHIEKAVVIYRQLYRLRLKVHGHLHEETHILFEVLVTYLKQLSFTEEVLELNLEHHEHLENTLVITDERRISSTLAIIQTYEDRKEIFKAEEALVRFWKAVSTAKVTTRTTELKIDFALKYSKFLQCHSRKEESEVILRGLWTEMQSYSYETRFEKSMIKRIQTIAESFSQLEVFAMSRSIYQSLYEHYERHEQRTSTECITIVRSLAETITKSISYLKTEKSTSTSSVSSTTSTVVSKEEKTLKEVFESSIESTEITSTTISICQALCSSYIHEERYEEASEIYSRVISKVWSSIETTSISTEITEITEHLTEETFELAFSLAHCHFKMLRIEIAETIYFNLFRALIATHTIDNRHFLLTKIKFVINFFQETYEYERVIEIYRELFVWMPIAFGKTHSETIVILLDFARTCFRMRLYREAATACSYIYSCFQIAHDCLHYDGFEAAFLLTQIYEIEEKWQQAYEVYGYLWRTFVRFGAEYKLDVKIVEKISTRYLYNLQYKQTVEYNVVLQVAKEYYESSVKFYGHHHETTIRATLQYAHICEQHEQHHESAVHLYEQVIKYCKETKSEFSAKTLYTCNTNIAKVYASNTKEISKAVSIYSEQFEQSKKTQRTSTETITALHSLVTTYKKQSTTESITTATNTLKSTVLEIFHQETQSEKLIESARSIATIYKEAGFHEQSETLIRELRTKIIEEVKSSKVSSSYVFLASFQEAISESSSFSSIMAETRSELLMYESYFKATKTQSDHRSIIKSGTALYFYLEQKSDRKSEFTSIEKDLMQYFYKYLSISHEVRESVLEIFFRMYVKEINKVEYEHSVTRQVTATVLEYTKAGKFGEAYDLVILIDRFIHLHGGFHSEFYIRIGFDLAKYLVGVEGAKKCTNEKLYTSMLDLSRVILQEALQGLDKVDIELVELQQLLHDLITVLSLQKKYQELERILQTLWQTRTIRSNISSSPLVLYLGLSLIQTLACLDKFHDAIHLAYHIRYNLAYIRGALDSSTIFFTTLLSQLYTQQGRYREAMDLHDDILSRLGEGQSAPNLSPLSIAMQHVALLEYAYKRSGKLDKSTQHYADIFYALDHRFSGDKDWASKRPQLEKWTAGVKEGDTFGSWQKPAVFELEFEGEESGEGAMWREEEVQRRVSSNYWSGKKNGYASNGNGTANGNANGNANANGNGVKVNGSTTANGKAPPVPASTSVKVASGSA